MMNPATNFTGADATVTSPPAITTSIHQCRSSNSFGNSIETTPAAETSNGITGRP